MKEYKIRLATIEDAKTFVSKAMKCEFDIDLYYNRVMIDAKSILGVLSLDLTRILNVRLHGNSEAFEDYLKTIEVEGAKIA